MIDFKTMESDVVSDLGIGLTATKGKVVSVRNYFINGRITPY